MAPPHADGHGDSQLGIVTAGVSVVCGARDTARYFLAERRRPHVRIEASVPAHAWRLGEDRAMPGALSAESIRPLPVALTVASRSGANPAVLDAGQGQYRAMRSAEDWLRGGPSGAVGRP